MQLGECRRHNVCYSSLNDVRYSSKSLVVLRSLSTSSGYYSSVLHQLTSEDIECAVNDPTLPSSIQVKLRGAEVASLKHVATGRGCIPATCVCEKL